MANSFVMHEEWTHVVVESNEPYIVDLKKVLSDAEYKGWLCDIVAYCQHGTIPCYSDVFKQFAFSLIMKRFQDDKRKYAKKLEFTPPTIEEIVECMGDRGSLKDAEAFKEKYDSIGWKTTDGKDIKSWKSLLSNFLRFQRESESLKQAEIDAQKI